MSHKSLEDVARWCGRRAAGVAAVYVVGALTLPADARAQVDDGFRPPIAGTWEPVQSMGQPLRLKPFAGLGFGVAPVASEAQVGVTGSLGVYRDFMNPVVGLLGASGQVYAGQRGELLDGGVRAYVSSPALFLHAGVDWNARMNRADFVLSTSIPTTRGGWFRRGGELRIDWVPTRDHSVVVGASVPLNQPFAGRTRPRQVDVPLPQPPSAHRLPPPQQGPTRDAVVELQRSMLWVTRLHNIFWETEPRRLQSGRPNEQTRAVMRALREELEAREALDPGRNTYEREIERYHAMLERAFSLAIAESPLRSADAATVGRELADRARHIALVEVVLPYNRTIGQYKKPDVLDGLIARARARFVALELLARQDRDAALRSLQVFDTWLGSFEFLRQRLAELTNDSRMHWLPLAFVLQPHEHETQHQIDALIEFALGTELTTGNATLYINAPQFQTELERTIAEAQEYHVLWVHDYRGRNPDGEPDRTGYMQTRSYLRALLGAVRAYDTTGRLPVFILMLDQHSYEIHDSRLWLTLLERPLTHRVRLGAAHAGMQQEIDALQDSLRLAVAASRRMIAETAAFGPQWPDQVIKVHINITNPSDFSFRSSRLLGLSIGADNLMRDHRKLVIRDITEADPAAGEVILAGVGVGDIYTSTTWEDRAVILHGPAALEAKAAARAVLEMNGLRGDDLPAPLRPVPFALDYAQRVEALERSGATARVMQAHNRTGWGDKAATFVQMLLYDLAPAGTVIYVPDSLWANYEWLAQLVSAALRGCKVYIVAPARDHAPSAGFPQMSVMQELITRTVIVQQELGGVMAEAGGEMHLGLYTRQAAMDDLGARVREVEATFERAPFLRELFPFSEQAWSVIRQFRDVPPQLRADLPPDAYGRPPLLHRKTQLIASEALIRELVGAAAMPDVLADLLRAEVEGLVYAPQSGPLHEQPRMQPYLRLLELYESLPEDVRAASLVYFMVGSLNKDVRSMALDGEAIALVANGWALQAVLDFFLLSGAVTWVETLDDVNALAPPYPPLKRWIGRLLHRVL